MTSDNEEIRLLFLLSGSSDLPPSYIKLRSYLNIHLSNLADQHNLKLLKSFRNRHKTCLNCYSPWSAETTSFKLLPTKKYANQQHKLDENVKEIRNTLVLKCKVCTKKSLFSLVKARQVKGKVKKKESVKKKNESSDSVVNSKKMDYHSPGMLVKMKKSKPEQGNKQPSKIQSKSPTGPKDRRNLSNNGTKKLVPNPFAVQRQNQYSKKNDKKLKMLKQAMKQEQGSAKKTLQDFLSLV